MIKGVGCGTVKKVKGLLGMNKPQLVDFPFDIRRQSLDPSYLRGFAMISGGSGLLISFQILINSVN